MIQALFTVGVSAGNFFVAGESDRDYIGCTTSTEGPGSGMQ
jgi:hypothetical protein